jgi:hypothetical protein
MHVGIGENTKISSKINAVSLPRGNGNFILALKDG